MTTPETQAASTTPPPKSRAKLSIAVGIVVAFAVIVGLGQLALNKESTPLRADMGAATEAPTAPSAPSTQPQLTKVPATDSPLALRDPDDHAALGAIDAPLVLIEWTDLRCPFCAAFTNDTFPTIIDEYIDTGKVRLEVAPIAMFGEQSFDAAVATHAAGKQGMFFEYLQTVYAAAPRGGKPDLPRAVLVDFAETVGIPDVAQFTADLDSEELRTKVANETAFARQIGVSSVPFFVAGEVSLPGAQSIETFREYLDHFDIDSQ